MEPVTSELVDEFIHLGLNCHEALRSKCRPVWVRRVHLEHLVNLAGGGAIDDERESHDACSVRPAIVNQLLND